MSMVFVIVCVCSYLALNAFYSDPLRKSNIIVA